MEKNSPRNAPRNTGTEAPLAVARRAAGLTQHQLSDLLGVPFRTIQSWETGARKPPEYVERLILEKLDDLTPGQWLEVAMDYKCSNCGTEFHDDMLWIQGVDTFPKYCPECGKKMKEPEVRP